MATSDALNETGKGYPFIIMNFKVPAVLVFDQNPNSLDFGQRKVYQETRTAGGYVYEHWGKAPTTMKVNGLIKKVNSILTVDSTKRGAADSIMNSPDYILLQQMYEYDKKKFKSVTANLVQKSTKISSFISDTIIYYKAAIYTGFFTSLNIVEDGEQPFYNKYNFEFLVTATSGDYIRNMINNKGNGYATLGLGLLGSAGSIFRKG